MHVYEEKDNCEDAHHSRHLPGECTCCDVGRTQFRLHRHVQFYDEGEVHDDAVFCTRRSRSSAENHRELAQCETLETFPARWSHHSPASLRLPFVQHLDPLPCVCRSLRAHYNMIMIPCFDRKMAVSMSLSPETSPVREHVQAQYWSVPTLPCAGCQHHHPHSLNESRIPHFWNSLAVHSLRNEAYPQSFCCLTLLSFSMSLQFPSLNS